MVIFVMLLALAAVVVLVQLAGLAVGVVSLLATVLLASALLAEWLGPWLRRAYWRYRIPVRRFFFGPTLLLPRSLGGAGWRR